MPRILVALDDSCSSEKALQAAVQLAQQDNGRVAAVTVLEHGPHSLSNQPPPEVKVDARRRSEELLETAANFARSRGVRLKPLLREGHPAETILTCAVEENANLLVLGAGGNARLGDTADQVSNRCPCTVLIVR